MVDVKRINKILKRPEEEAPQTAVEGSTIGPDGKPIIPPVAKGEAAAAGEPALPPSPTIRDQETGQLSGLNIGGATFLGLPLRDFRAAADKAYPQTPAGLIEAETFAQSRQNQQAAQGVGQLTPEQLAAAQVGAQQGTQQLNQGEALLTGATYAAPGVAAGILGGAAAGAVGGPIGVVAGAVIGGASAFVAGYLSNLRSQRGEEIATQVTNLKDSKTELSRAVSFLNAGGDVATAKQIYQDVVLNTYKNWQQLKLETQGNSKIFGNAQRELQQYENFFDEEHGLLLSYNNEFAQAAVNPNPRKITADFISNFSPE